MLRTLGIRSKLLLLVAVPMVLLLGMSSVLVGSSRTTAAEAERVERLTDAGTMLASVVYALQDERAATVRWIAAPDARTKEARDAVRPTTDQLVGQLRRVIDEHELASSFPGMVEAISEAQRQSARLAEVRADVDAGTTGLNPAQNYYTFTVGSYLALADVVAEGAGDERLSGALRAHSMLSRVIEAAAQERDLFARVLVGPSLSLADYRLMQSYAVRQDAGLETFRALATPEQVLELETAFSPEERYALNQQRVAMGEWLLGGDRGDLEVAVRSSSALLEALKSTESAVLSQVDRLATGLAQEESRRTYVVATTVLASVTIVLLLVLVVSRRLVAPLQRLTSQAVQVGEALPQMVERMRVPGQGPDVELEPVPVESRDEIGQLAAAFNAVNEVTVRVAQEQAALRASIAETYVNVARRNQVLLGRQLAFIDTLEQREENPDQLQNLFRLDHLATRMRRNAESLLVLAGVDANRRLRRPMPLSDVVRTAASEIEQFERVDLAATADPPVAGRHALTVAHLLAELLENATHFSDPHTRVLVRTARATDGVQVTIVDAGLGMSEEEVAAANERIAAPPVGEVASAQRLGFLVVGRLAERLGIAVELRRGEPSGLVATLHLPADVFEGSALPAAGPGAVTSSSASAAAVPAPALAPAPVVPAPVVPAPVAAAPVPAARPAPSRPAPVPPAATGTPLFPGGGTPGAQGAVPAALQDLKPAATPVFAPAVDILPGRPLERRGLRRKGGGEGPAAPAVEPSPVTQAPPAPAAAPQPATWAAAPAAPVPAGPPSPLPTRAAPATASAPSQDVDAIAAGAQLHSAALAELSRLSGGYEPAVAAAEPDPNLTRRQPRASEAAPAPAVRPAAATAAPRDPAEVRSRLSSFRAGVERGRSGPPEVPSP